MSGAVADRAEASSGETLALAYEVDAAAVRRVFEKTPIVNDTFELRCSLREKFERLEGMATRAWQRELAAGGSLSPSPTIADLLRRRRELDREDIPQLELADRKLKVDREIADLRAKTFAEADAARMLVGAGESSQQRADERLRILDRRRAVALCAYEGDIAARIEFEAIEARLAELKREDTIEALAAVARAEQVA